MRPLERSAGSLRRCPSVPAPLVLEREPEKSLKVLGRQRHDPTGRDFSGSRVHDLLGKSVFAADVVDVALEDIALYAGFGVRRDARQSHGPANSPRSPQVDCRIGAATGEVGEERMYLRTLDVLGPYAGHDAHCRHGVDAELRVDHQCRAFDQFSVVIEGVGVLLLKRRVEILQGDVVFRLCHRGLGRPVALHKVVHVSERLCLWRDDFSAGCLVFVDREILSLSDKDNATD